VAIMQFSKRPVQSRSNPCKSFKWLSMVNEEVGKNGGNESTRIFRVKETATELSFFDIADWRCFYDGFCVVANKPKGHRTNAACQKFSAGITGQWGCILPKAFAAAKQAAG
jgi:hypothetical protein